MKTINDITTEINETLGQIRELRKVEGKTPTQASKDEKKSIKLSVRVKELKQIRMYLEIAPAFELLLRQKTELGKKIKDVESGFPEFCRLNTDTLAMSESKKKSHYNKLHNLKDLKLQLKTIQYLLA